MKRSLLILERLAFEHHNDRPLEMYVHAVSKSRNGSINLKGLVIVEYFAVRNRFEDMVELGTVLKHVTQLAVGNLNLTPNLLSRLRPILGNVDVLLFPKSTWWKWRCDSFLFPSFVSYLSWMMILSIYDANYCGVREFDGRKYGMVLALSRMYLKQLKNRTLLVGTFCNKPICFVSSSQLHG